MKDAIVIDFRSDTLTKPCSEMIKVMTEAEVGDDVYGEDPSVSRLERIASEMMGKEDALFVPSGTQSNLLALLTHCGRGDEYIAGQAAHLYRYEGGGAAVLGGIQPQPISFEADSTLDLNSVKSVIKPDDSHFARTKLLCLENTQAGQVLSLDYLKAAHQFTVDHTLGLHLDGARVFNAAVKLNVHVSEITQYFDTVSVCLSKGLGAPVGSVLCGGQPFIKEARRWRKVLGGGMRQAGILAAAGIFGLTHNVERLAEDHDNAAYLAQALSEIEALSVEFSPEQTNMVFISMDEGCVESLNNTMLAKGIQIAAEPRTRLVIHKDISKSDIDTAIDVFKAFFKGV